MTRATQVALALALALGWLGCGIDRGVAFERAFHEGKRHYHAGRYEQAASAYAKAAAEGKRVKDRDEAIFLEARMREKLGQWKRAQAAYRRLVAVSPKGPRTGRAHFEIAQIERRHGDAKRGWALTLEAIEKYPSHGGARLALTRLVEHMQGEGAVDAGKEVQVRTLMTRLARDLVGSEAEQQAKVLHAQSFEREGKLVEAHRGLIAAARQHPYPSGTLTDDALWHASQVAEKMGDFKQAVADLEELLAGREEAQGGSYERPRNPAAQLRIGQLYRDKLQDLPRARAAFRRMRKRHQSSILADDAAWAELLVARRQGDTEGVCDVADDIADDFPRARYVKCLPVVCAKRKPVPGTRDCPAYLRREIEAAAPPSG